MRINTQDIKATKHHHLAEAQARANNLNYRNATNNNNAGIIGDEAKKKNINNAIVAKLSGSTQVI